jgi:hypothetical protein
MSRNLRLQSEVQLRAMQRKIRGEDKPGAALAKADALYRPDPEQRQPEPEAAAPGKYHNRPTDGYASAREAKRAEVLKLLAVAGRISELREQVPFVLVPGQDGSEDDCYTRPITYVADFVYLDHRRVMVVEDVKGVRTEVFNLKRKLMLWRYGIRVQLV